MKLTIEANELKKILSVLLPADRFGVATVNLNTVEGSIHTIGPELSVRVINNLLNKTEEDGQVVVRLAKLYEIISKLDGQINLSLGGKILQIKSGRTRFQLPTHGTTRKFPKFSRKDFKAFPRNIFMTGLTFTASGSNKKTEQFATNCIKLESQENEYYKFTGTDGFRILSFDWKSTGPTIPLSVLVNISAVDVLSKMNGDYLDFYEAENALHFTSSPNIAPTLTDLIVQKTNKPFPNVESIYPQDYNILISVSVSELWQALKRVEPGLEENSSKVVLGFGGSSLVIDTGVEGNGASDEIEVNDDSMVGNKRIQLNHRHLIEFLSKISEKNVSIAIVDSYKPVLFTAGSYSMLAAQLV